MLGTFRSVRLIFRSLKRFRGSADYPFVPGAVIRLRTDPYQDEGPHKCQRSSCVGRPPSTCFTARREYGGQRLLVQGAVSAVGQALLVLGKRAGLELWVPRAGSM